MDGIEIFNLLILNMLLLAKKKKVWLQYLSQWDWQKVILLAP
jgi:hypothetical protein